MLYGGTPDIPFGTQQTETRTDTFQTRLSNEVDQTQKVKLGFEWQLLQTIWNSKDMPNAAFVCVHVVGRFLGSAWVEKSRVSALG